LAIGSVARHRHRSAVVGAWNWRNRGPSRGRPRRREYDYPWRVVRDHGRRLGADVRHEH
jgi:hypothetical protein